MQVISGARKFATAASSPPRSPTRLILGHAGRVAEDENPALGVRRCWRVGSKPLWVLPFGCSRPMIRI